MIGAIEGFFHTQKRFSSQGKEDTKSRTGLLIGVPDLADDTAARFAAGRYRRTFRSLRPLLPDEEELAGASDSHEDEEEDQPMPSQLVLSKQQLDERRVFCAMLIDEWVANPGNVRLLRIALDMFPDHDFLDQILILLKPVLSEHGARARREVQAYRLAELFRAGATETGMVKDERLPSGVSLKPIIKDSLKRQRRSL